MISLHFLSDIQFSGQGKLYCRSAYHTILEIIYLSPISLISPYTPLSFIEWLFSGNIQTDSHFQLSLIFSPVLQTYIHISYQSPYYNSWNTQGKQTNLIFKRSILELHLTTFHVQSHWLLSFPTINPHSHQEKPSVPAVSCFSLTLLVLPSIDSFWGMFSDTKM